MASNLLWAHLLRKDATTTDTPSQIPPIAPLDKTGTTMRMLIHDTQVNLEKFSTRLDSLLQRVDDCRAQVVNANKLLDVERDKILAEMLEIAHKCQSEMKAHVGMPAQASALDLVRASQVSTERSVQALEKRIDALQTILQTHAHAMQSIQDQQNTLISAVLPLVPVIHGVSPQIDQVKTVLSDMIANAVSTMTTSVESVRSSLVAESAHGHEYARPSTRVRSASKTSQHKLSDVSALGPQEIYVPVSSPLDRRGPHLSHKRPRVEGLAHQPGTAGLPRKVSRLGMALTNPGLSPPLVQTPKTPRKPLADLFLIPGSNTSSVQQHRNSTSRGGMLPGARETLWVASSPSISRPLTSRRPLRPFEHAGPDFRDPVITRRHSGRSHDVRLAVDESDIGLPIAGPSNRDIISKEIKIEESAEANVTGVISIDSSPLSPPPLSAPLETRHDPRETCSMLSKLRFSREQDNLQLEPVHVPPPSFCPMSSNLEASPPKSMSLRDRRAQMSKFGRRETRRFIPLVPWSDEDG